MLRSGGVYADIDVECRKPLNSLIMPRDTLIVGWENEFSSAEEARSRKYVRKRQVRHDGVCESSMMALPLTEGPERVLASDKASQAAYQPRSNPVLPNLYGVIRGGGSALQVGVVQVRNHRASKERVRITSPY